MKNMKISNFRRNVPGRLHLRAAALFLCTAGLLAGCTKEPFEEPGGPEGELTEITLSPESMGEVAMDTRAVSGVDENKVTDLWVVQLNSGGTAQLQAPQYITNISASGSSYTAKARIKAAESRIYFIANTHNSTLFNDATTSALIEAKTLSVTNEASITAENTLPMAGYFSGTPTVGIITNISLKRAVAKLTVKLASDIADGGSFTLTSVKVYNAPKVLHWFRDPSKPVPTTTAADCYPATSAGVNTNWTDLTPSDKTLSATAKECGGCYLPENGRGQGTAGDQKDKTAAKALGGASGQGNYATYIEIIGDYTTDLGDKYTGNKYRFYLGRNAFDDYNVLRNSHYTVTATIKGLHKWDARITVGTETLNSNPDYYDYTDNRTGRFVYARTNTGSGMSWKNAQLECAKTPGWRLPTLTELNIMYCMRDEWTTTSNGFSNNSYWSGTCISGTIFWNRNLGVGDGNGRANSNDMVESRFVRCIRAL